MTQTVGRGGTIPLDAIFKDGAHQLVDPTVPLVDIINPSSVAVVTNAVPVHDSLGRYHYDYTVPGDAPLGIWTAHWTGTINDAPVDDDDPFVVTVAGGIEFPAGGSWATAEGVLACCAGVEEGPVLDAAIEMASSWLYILSGRQFSGVKEWEARPLGDCGCHRQVLAGYGAEVSAPGAWGPGSERGCCWPSTVVLRQANLHEVTSVKIDGVTVPEGEWRLDRGRYLRALNGRGWPCFQDLGLSATEPGTFAVYYTAGLDVPADGGAAAVVMACELAKACAGDTECRLPDRVQTVARRGVTVSLAELRDLAKGGFGVPEIDGFLNVHNPGGLRRPVRLLAADDPPEVRRPV